MVGGWIGTSTGEREIHQEYYTPMGVWRKYGMKITRPRVRYFGHITVPSKFIDEFVCRLPHDMFADIKEYNHYTNGVCEGRYIQVKTFTAEGNEVLVWDEPINEPRDQFLTQMMLLT
jgi:hypothetical protein